jgi:phage gp36-like protein
MSYAALSDLVAQFGDREVLALTDRDGDGVADALVYGMALQRASNTIDAYLAARYPLPLSVVPDQLVDICCDIARYKLCGAEVAETDAVSDRYKDALKTLGLIRDGKIDIGLTLAGAAPVESASVRVVGGGRTFSRNNLSDY